MTKYVGVCYDSGGWGGDLTGLLVAEDPEGWAVAASHISSGSGWAERDIRYHYDRLHTSADDTFEWAGVVSVPELEARFGWSKASPEAAGTPS